MGAEWDNALILFIKNLFVSGLKICYITIIRQLCLNQRVS